MGRPGLIQKKVKVKTKRGTALRTMWVKANPKASLKSEGGSGFLARHGGKIKTGLKIAGAVAGAAYLAHKHGKGIAGAIGGARLGRAMVKDYASSMGGKAGLKHQALGMLHGATQGLRNHHGDSERGSKLISGAKSGASRLLSGAKFAGEIARHPVQAGRGVRDFLAGGRKAVESFKSRQRKT